MRRGRWDQRAHPLPHFSTHFPRFGSGHSFLFSFFPSILPRFYRFSDKLLVLQHLLSDFTGGSQLAIVGSTLAIAALFQPLRRRIQRIIDRHFYRRTYDATRTLTAFSATLRHEVDLSQLREQLVVAVEETMQPTHISLWLSHPEPSRERNTRLLPRMDQEESHSP